METVYLYVYDRKEHLKEKTKRAGDWRIEYEVERNK